MIEYSANRTIAQILQDGFYEIPRFQRAYSWTLDNVGELWSDTIQQGPDQYFIGAIIVYRRTPSEEESTARDFAIVDGQQRLTTITVLLAALRDHFKKIGRDNLAQGVQRYIRREDRRNDLQLIISTEGGFPYFQSAIQSFPAEEAPSSGNRQDERLLAQAYAYFAGQLDDLAKSIVSDSMIAKENKNDELVRRLEAIRDRILGLLAILVSVDNEDDAYVIFETLNARGKDLGLTDLLRNFLLRDLRTTTSQVDMPKHRFKEILNKLQDTGVGLSTDEFIFHSWLSRHNYTAKRSIFREIKREITSKSAKERLLRELEQDCDLYRQIRQPSKFMRSSQMAPIADSLEALRTFGVAQPIPLLLAGLRAYTIDRSIQLKALKRLFASIESFHFQYTAVVGRSSSGGISQRYAREARSFQRASRTSANFLIDGIILRLKRSLPSEAEFVAAFSELATSSGNTTRKSIVRYALEQLYRYSSSAGVVVDFTRMTLEHIAPENPASEEDELDAKSVESIGNIILVSEVLNNKLQNKSFPAKKRILLADNQLWIDDSIRNAASWSGEEIAARGKELGKLACQKVWHI